eukprot:UN4571
MIQAAKGGTMGSKALRVLALIPVFKSLKDRLARLGEVADLCEAQMVENIECYNDGKAFTAHLHQIKGAKRATSSGAAPAPTVPTSSGAAPAVPPPAVPAVALPAVPADEADEDM